MVEAEVGKALGVDEDVDDVVGTLVGGGERLVMSSVSLSS